MVGAAAGGNLLSRDSFSVMSSLQESRLGQFLRVSRQAQSYVLELCVCHPNALSAVAIYGRVAKGIRAVSTPA